MSLLPRSWRRARDSASEHPVVRILMVSGWRRRALSVLRSTQSGCVFCGS